jgi:hypothetical protein
MPGRRVESDWAGERRGAISRKETNRYFIAKIKKLE